MTCPSCEGTRKTNGVKCWVCFGCGVTAKVNKPCTKCGIWDGPAYTGICRVCIEDEKSGRNWLKNSPAALPDPLSGPTVGEYVRINYGNLERFKKRNQ